MVDEQNYNDKAIIKKGAMSGIRCQNQSAVSQQQLQQKQQQQHAQQQLYMSPQTENLRQMYLLVHKLSGQLQANKTQKQKLLSNIDILSEQLNKGKNNDPREAADEHDLVIFNRFLETRGITSRMRERDDLTTLREQNKELKRILSEKVSYNKKTLELLEDHEDGLTEIVSMLRDDVFKYYKTFTERVRKSIQTEMIPLEDAEFTLYLENIDDIQQLMDISAVYRSLLRIHE